VIISQILNATWWRDDDTGSDGPWYHASDQDGAQVHEFELEKANAANCADLVKAITSWEPCAWTNFRNICPTTCAGTDSDRMIFHKYDAKHWTGEVELEVLMGPQKRRRLEEEEGDEKEASKSAYKGLRRENDPTFLPRQRIWGAFNDPEEGNWEPFTDILSILSLEKATDKYYSLAFTLAGVPDQGDWDGDIDGVHEYEDVEAKNVGILPAMLALLEVVDGDSYQFANETFCKDTWVCDAWAGYTAEGSAVWESGILNAFNDLRCDFEAASAGLVAMWNSARNCIAEHIDVVDENTLLHTFFKKGDEAEHVMSPITVFNGPYREIPGKRSGLSKDMLEMDVAVDGWLVPERTASSAIHLLRALGVPQYYGPGTSMGISDSSFGVSFAPADEFLMPSVATCNDDGERDEEVCFYALGEVEPFNAQSP